MVNFTIYYVLVHSSMLMALCLSAMMMAAWYRSFSKMKDRLFDFLNQFYGRWILLTSVILLNWFGALLWLAHVSFMVDAMSFELVAHFTERNELATPLGTIRHDDASEWYVMLLLGVVSAKGSTVIYRGASFLFKDYLGHAPNGEWGPVSHRIDIN